MAQLDDLAKEVVALIFEYVVDTSPKSALAFGTTCRSHYWTYKLVSHRHKRIMAKSDEQTPMLSTDDIDFLDDMDFRDLMRFTNPVSSSTMSFTDLEAWKEDEIILRGIRHLVVDQAPQTHRSSPSSVNDFVDLLQKLSKLTCLDWNFKRPIPPSILEALHRHQPEAELRIFQYDISSPLSSELFTIEPALSKLPALTAIKVNMKGSINFPDLRLASFQKIVACAPNLKFASISSFVRSREYAMSDEQRNTHRTRVQEMHKDIKPSTSIRRLTLDGFKIGSLALADWGKFIDLAVLENVKFSRGGLNADYFAYAAQKLVNLKHVSLNLANASTEVGAAAEDYLGECSLLRSLSLWSWMKHVKLDTIISRHGPTLERLELHEREMSAQVHPERPVADSRDLLTADQVERIRTSLPRLRDFTMDCTRHSQGLETEVEEDAVISELRQMSLSRLQIYYDLGLASIDSAPGQRVMRGGFLGLQGEQSEHDAIENEREDSLTRLYRPNFVGVNLQRNTSQPQVRIPPSKHDQIEAYATQLWEYIFGSRLPATSRTLELKFGEWERKSRPFYASASSHQRESRWVVTPHERDDEHGKCVVTK
jgi:hypothetical protein